MQVHTHCVTQSKSLSVRQSDISPLNPRRPRQAFGRRAALRVTASDDEDMIPILGGSRKKALYAAPHTPPLLRALPLSPPQALNLFRSHTGATQRFRVDLRKVVPHGAGLGGGSGNAATALWAANELCGRPATAAQLQAWSGAIGSDISVFFSLGAAYCTGRGEVVEDVAPPLPLDTPLLLVKPPVGLSTPEIFGALDLGRRSTADPLELLAALAAGGALTPELTVNDLEQPAFDRWGGGGDVGGE